jgi:hypothetical protein
MIENPKKRKKREKTLIAFDPSLHIRSETLTALDDPTSVKKTKTPAKKEKTCDLASDSDSLPPLSCVTKKMCMRIAKSSGSTNLVNGSTIGRWWEKVCKDMQVKLHEIVIVIADVTRMCMRLTVTEDDIRRALSDHASDFLSEELPKPHAGGHAALPFASFLQKKPFEADLRTYLDRFACQNNHKSPPRIQGGATELLKIAFTRYIYRWYHAAAITSTVSNGNLFFVDLEGEGLLAGQGTK